MLWQKVSSQAHVNSQRRLDREGAARTVRPRELGASGLRRRVAVVSTVTLSLHPSPKPHRGLARAQPAQGPAAHRRLAHARDANHDLERRRAQPALARGDYPNVESYLVSLLDRLGYPTRIKNLQNVPNPPLRFAASRTRAQAALTDTDPGYPSGSQIIQADFACQSFEPRSTVNPNLSEFCDHRVDAQIAQARAAERDNSPATAALWARADRTVTSPGRSSR